MHLDCSCHNWYKRWNEKIEIHTKKWYNYREKSSFIVCYYYCHFIYHQIILRDSTSLTHSIINDDQTLITIKSYRVRRVKCRDLWIIGWLCACFIQQTSQIKGVLYSDALCLIIAFIALFTKNYIKWQKKTTMNVEVI